MNFPFLEICSFISKLWNIHTYIFIYTIQNLKLIIKEIENHSQILRNSMNLKVMQKQLELQYKNASETKEERRSEEISTNVYPFEGKISEINGREVG